ncbi:MAG: hypothetical protein HOB64_08435 [Rhodospirillaceae bacterium]|jgi:hypothetical protein|nr:hypothetical protein [Rhodospirillaceae bacterium]MBT4718160.1 hypothetical protein [Rhodospirillaceae bacterium]MBT7030935.1 hypothetical protein [Rhodospirillaceae bacterium]
MYVIGAAVIEPLRQRIDETPAPGALFGPLAFLRTRLLLVRPERQPIPDTGLALIVFEQAIKGARIHAIQNAPAEIIFKALCPTRRAGA